MPSVEKIALLSGCVLVAAIAGHMIGCGIALLVNWIERKVKK